MGRVRVRDILKMISNRGLAQLICGGMDPDPAGSVCAHFFSSIRLFTLCLETTFIWPFFHLLGCKEAKVFLNSRIRQLMCFNREAWNPGKHAANTCVKKHVHMFVKTHIHFLALDTSLSVEKSIKVRGCRHISRPHLTSSHKCILSKWANHHQVEWPNSSVSYNSRLSLIQISLSVFW